MTRRLILALAPAVALFAASAACAQAPGGHPPGMHDGPPAEMKAAHEAMMKQHVEDLKTVLRLRPDQEPALQAFIAAHHPMGEGMDHMHGPMEPKAMSTPERLDAMAKREAEMAAQHDKMRKALATFYAALSPDQQKVFDALSRLQGPMGGHMGMMGGGPRMERRMMMRGPGGPMPGHEPD